MEAIHARQDELFTAWIHGNADDTVHMQFVFSLAAGFAYERRRALLGEFLERNASFEDFERLNLEPRTWMWRGSQVPMIQKRLEFFQSLLPYFNDIRFRSQTTRGEGDCGAPKGN
jgi:hypothetical protein